MPPPAEADLCVLLTPRQPGGHELALLDWLGEAVRELGLRPWLVASTPELEALCRAQGLARWLADPAPAASGPWTRVRAALQAWPRHRPLLLAPGVLHVQAWLTAALQRRRPALWLYVPMTHSARQMGYRGGAWRDRLLRPWLRGVAGWIVPDEGQARRLRDGWGCRQAPVQVLPNLGRVSGPAPAWPAPDAQGRLRVAVVGRFDAWQKGLDWLAGQLWHSARPDHWAHGLHWRLQGRGPDAALLRALADRLGPQRIALHGHGPLDAALAASDLLMLPSRYEGVPLVALEATRRGWPVLATHEAGLTGLLPAESLFSRDDTAGLAHTLQALRDPAERQRRVALARARLDAADLPRRREHALRQLAGCWRRPAC